MVMSGGEWEKKENALHVLYWVGWGEKKKKKRQCAKGKISGRGFVGVILDLYVCVQKRMDKWK